MSMYQGKHFISGLFSQESASAFIRAQNPANKEEYGLFPKAEKHTVEKAVKAARDAFPEWRKLSRVKRAELFDTLAQLVKRDHDILKRMISDETGKNLNESHAEVVEALHMCQVAAASGRQPYGECIASEISEKDARVIRKPKGVVAVISPWNFPLAIGSFWSSAPALVEGNTVVHKPSELTPMIAQKMAELYDEAGFPPGVFNLVHGDGETGDHLVKADVEVILFTGSAEVGQLIRQHCATTWNKTCSTECGSKSAVIVFDDADQELALNACLASAFKLSGQRCVSGSRILVQRGILDTFAKKFVDKVRTEATTGAPTENNPPMYGPLISAEQKDKVLFYNKMVRDDEDAQVLYDGNEAGSPVEGHFLRPFVFQCEWDDKRFFKEEVFGPHAAIIPFDSADDAIRIYNDTDFGLALGVITNDYRIHRKCEQECTTGMLYINGGSVAAESHLPFSSWKKSGNSSSASATWKAVTHTTAITTNYEYGLTFAQGLKI